MQDLPPAQLVEMLERLGLATAAQVARIGPRVRRLAGDLPQFESIWVDALAQARVLTPFQAEEINAGRAPSLRVGPYLLCQRLAQPCYVATYRARAVDSQETVRLAVVENCGARTDVILQQLESLVRCVKRTADQESGSGAFHAPHEPAREFFAPIAHAGIAGDRIFAASPWVAGRTASDWMIHHGRFPPGVVLAIARAMLTGLVELEQLGICHADVSASSLVLTDGGSAVLSMPGLRGILRPEEGYAHGDLLPEAYDSLAPERISAGLPANVRSDIYACGCVWWHLLCGRPPLAGGSSLAKLRAAQAAEICDVRRHAPDTPAPLAAAISACLEREPSRRPESMRQLAALLGSPTRSGREELTDFLGQASRSAVHWTTTVRSIRQSRRTPFWLAGAVCSLAAAVAICWPIWHAGSRLPTAESGLQAATSPARRTEDSKSKSRQTAAITNQKPDSAHSSTPTPDCPTPVVQAAYQQIEAKTQDLVLAADKPMRLVSLDLRPGQCVRGPTSKRVTAIVPRDGLLIEKEDIRFDNIDFVWVQPADADNVEEAEPALLQLVASRATFRGCSFQWKTSEVKSAQNGNAKTHAPAAVRWVQPGKGGEAEISLPNGRLRFVDCVFHRLAQGVDCRTAGALALEFDNTLHLNAGPLVRLDHCPKPDEPVSIALSQVTLRGGGPLLEYAAPPAETQPGEITILSAACAFAPDQGEPLVRLRGSVPPGRLLAGLRWSGQGSLVAPGVPIFAWRGPDGRQESADESSLSIAGLVRSDVGFAGWASGDPASSRLIRWQAPLQSSSAPGIDSAPLPNIRAR